MKKMFVFAVSFIVAFAVVGAVIPAHRTTALTATTSQTGDNYDAGAEVSVYFTYTFDGTETNGQSIALAIVPGQSRLIDGELNIEASGVASTNTLGIAATDGSGYYSLDGSTDADDVDGLLTAFSTEAAKKDTFCNLVAGDLKAADVVEKDVFIVMGVTSDLIPTNKVVKGVVRFIR
jgi:hypothetical protein